MKISTNYIVNVVSVILYAFSLSGLNIDPDATAAQIITVLTTGNYTALFVLLLNLGNSLFQWIKTLRTDFDMFWSFLRSTNWWTSFLNMAVGLVIYAGYLLPTDIPAELSTEVAQYAAEGSWLVALIALVSNVANILIHKLTKNPAKIAA